MQTFIMLVLVSRVVPLELCPDFRAANIKQTHFPTGSHL